MSPKIQGSGENSPERNKYFKEQDDEFDDDEEDDDDQENNGLINDFCSEFDEVQDLRIQGNRTSTSPSQYDSKSEDNILADCKPENNCNDCNKNIKTCDSF